MEKLGEIYIAPDRKKEEYINLNLTINSNKNDWDIAISICQERIQGRFLDQIKVLSNDCNKNGFTIMALNCLLIEALLQFEEGLEDTKNNNRQKYKRFLTDKFSDYFKNDKQAEIFYTDIRCGILHSAQTYGHARLTADTDYVIKEENDILKISVLNFSDELEEYFNNYINALHDETNTILRENFIKKMKYICKIEGRSTK